jgi:hypothetical protein
MENTEFRSQKSGGNTGITEYKNGRIQEPGIEPGLAD